MAEHLMLQPSLSLNPVVGPGRGAGFFSSPSISLKLTCERAALPTFEQIGVNKS